MGAHRQGDRLARATVACALCAAALALPACGGGSDDASSSTSSSRPTTQRTTPPTTAQPPSQSLTGGADGRSVARAQRRQARQEARRRLATFRTAMNAACARAVAPPLAKTSRDASRDDAWAARLQRAHDWLGALRTQLGDVPIPGHDRHLRKLRHDYRAAARNEMVLDRIVIAGIRSHDDRLGIDAGDHQNHENRELRKQLARALKSDCLARFVAD